MKATYTHKGWFGICPVYLAKIETDAPVVEPRWRFLGCLLVLSEAVFGLIIYIATAINPDYEPAWPLLITGQLSGE